MVNEKLNILKILIENKNEKFTIRNLSILRKINYKSAYEAIHKLEKEKIISVEKQGNSKLCSFNNKFNQSVFFVEYERRQNLLKNKDFKIITKKLKSLNFPLIVLLFGSHAKKKNQKNSDIDLLIISDNNQEIQTKLSTLPLNIHLIDFSFKEFISGLDRKSFNIISEAVNNNIILIGIEEYYRLVNNAYI